MTCEVCNGLGTYPIIDRFGTTRYEIKCPECLGISDEELKRSTEQAAGDIANWRAGRTVSGDMI